MKVTVPEGYAYGHTHNDLIPASVVELRPDNEAWEVLLDGERVGWVWKGSRTYSPPTRRGSRIARYHRQVPEWHGHPAQRFSPKFRRDTRAEVIRNLIAETRKGERR